MTAMSDLPITTLGRTGLQVTRLGYGAMELRGSGSGAFGSAITDEEASAILNAVLDAGINYIDTSPDYGTSEELIGQCISSRRDEFYLASKCGCPVALPPNAPAGQHVFTPENVRAAVEQSLRRMQTDHLDVMQLHGSPSQAVIEADGALGTLVDLQSEGKIRFLGSSSTLPNITAHIAMGVFDVFQIPYSALERDHEDTITQANRAHAGIVIRGGVARGLPDPDTAFASVPAEARNALQERYQRRADQLRRSHETYESANLGDMLDGMGRMEFLLRFTMSHPGMHTTIVGTANREHLAANVQAASHGVLPPDVYEEAKRRLR
jgi:aryl-alcohol dehydrogenase-like predicted oxidoreductase